MIKLQIPSLLMFALFIPIVGTSCSHKFDPDILDLDFYQWNLWYDTSPESGQVMPSCGWEDLHRGMGKLVRIPAMAADHFPGEEPGGVLWFHCRFTLPENWEDRSISLQIIGAAPEAALYLNQEQLATFSAHEAAFELDVSDRIYYTRDNHLAIRIRIPEDADWTSAGIGGDVFVKSIPPVIDQSERAGAQRP